LSATSSVVALGITEPLPEETWRQPSRWSRPGFEPGAVAELDRHEYIAEPTLRIQDVLARLIRRKDPTRKLIKDGAELGRRLQWLDGPLEGVPKSVVEIGRQTVSVNPSSLFQFLRPWTISRIGSTAP
jgi:hypothetical protein